VRPAATSGTRARTTDTNSRVPAPDEPDGDAARAPGVAVADLVGEAAGGDTDGDADGDTDPDGDADAAGDAEGAEVVVAPLSPSEPPHEASSNAATAAPTRCCDAGGRAGPPV
jgi:hypothetical protein